jgi:SAM-dependent methyltransferase
MQPEHWLATPLGRRCLNNEQRLVRRALDCAFGEQFLQIGTWGSSDLFTRYARTQRVAVLDEASPPAAEKYKDAMTGTVGSTVGTILSRLDRWGVASDSIDVLLLPHTLERTVTPHAVLREAARVLRPDGCLMALGFAPGGLWGLRHLLARDGYPPGSRHLILEGRLRDWLELLSFDVDPAVAYCHTLPFDGVRRFGSLPKERWARRWLPLLAGAYLLVARKRSASLTAIRPAFRRARLRAVGGLVEPTTRIARRTSR